MALLRWQKSNRSEPASGPHLGPLLKGEEEKAPIRRYAQTPTRSL
jgi:hypothetical protein